MEDINMPLLGHIEILTLVHSFHFHALPLYSKVKMIELPDRESNWLLSKVTAEA